ncbi:MAG: radical SAM protein, partial [Candidatus Bathyarchaeota archaeon]|nr:radical SAM protein [Candidatus Bathyarchaeota archaeon]
GLSASYFHEEIIQNFHQIDYILRGDTTEKPLIDLMGCIEKGLEPEEVENLTWRGSDGRKLVNPLSFVPEDIDDLWIDYGEVVKLVVRHRDLESALPYEDFMDYPFTAVLTCKGCSYDCVTCGGSSYAFKRFFNRERPVFKTPEKLVGEMAVISEYFKAPIFLIGDLRQAGMKWAQAVLDEIRREDLDNTITFELFNAVPEGYIKKMAKSTDSWTIEMSPESHDDRIRSLMGKPYTAVEMEKTVERALEHGCGKVDVYFMVGLPRQSGESALATVDYSRRLYEKMGRDERIYTFIAPMAPFLDPGSIVFENPQEHGYNLLYKTLKEHKEALYRPSWKLYLSYSTDWMIRDEIAETTYEAMIRMNELKAEMGVTDPGRAALIKQGLSMERDIMRKIDDIIASTSSETERALEYERLRREIEDAKKSTDISKRELRMPGTAGLRLKGALKYLLRWAGLLR